APRVAESLLLPAVPPPARREPHRRDGRAHCPGRPAAARRTGGAVGAPPDRPRGHRRAAGEAPERRRPVLPPPPIAAGDRPGARNPAGHREVAAPLRAPQPARPPRGGPPLRRRLPARRRGRGQGHVIEVRGECGRHRAALLDFVDHGEIVAGTAPALAHLERCARCTDELESTVLAITALRRFGDELVAAEPQPEAWPRLRARIETLRPARWAIMSPSAGMGTSTPLGAVLVAPVRVGPSTPSSAPSYRPASQLGVSLEERRVEAAYLANIRMGTFPTKEPARRPGVQDTRNYPDNIHPERKEVDPAEPSGKPPEAI